MSSEETPVEKVTFKKRKKQGNLRSLESKIGSAEPGATTNDQNNDDDEDSIDWSALDGYREFKRAKKRAANGINVLELNNEPKKPLESVKNEKREGGLTDLKTLVSELDLGNTFSLETNRRDEDAELMKYVEEELAKRRPNKSDEVGSGNKSAVSRTNLSDDLMIGVIPEHLLKISSEAKAKNEEMLSSQMLSGIPEVDLGIEERIRNIEKTEAARTKLLQEKLQHEIERASGSKGGLNDVSLVPNNLASCFTRNNIVQQAAHASNHRFNLNAMPSENREMLDHFISKEAKGNQNAAFHKQPPRQRTEYDIEPVVVLGAEPQKIRLPKPIDKDKRMPGKDKPQDDYIFEKFKKQIRKH